MQAGTLQRAPHFYGVGVLFFSILIPIAALILFAVLRRIIKLRSYYRTGKTYEELCSVAEIAILQYLFERWPEDKRFATCVASYLLSGTPTTPELLAYRDLYREEIEQAALRLRDEDPPFRNVVGHTLWVLMGECVAHRNRERYDKIMEDVLSNYRDCTLLKPDAYAALVAKWSETYRPLATNEE